MSHTLKIIKTMNALSICLFVICCYYMAVRSEETSTPAPLEDDTDIHLTKQSSSDLTKQPSPDLTKQPSSDLTQNPPSEISFMENQEGALTIVHEENEDEESKVEVEEDTSNIQNVNGQDKQFKKLDLFYPTKEWKLVKEGQAIPPGLHVRMNLQTGAKEAKLMEGDDGNKYWKAGDREGMMSPNKQYFSNQELKDALKEFKTTKFDEADPKREEEVLKKFKSYETLKKDFEQMNMGIKTDVEIITELVGKLLKIESNTEQVEQRKEILEELEYLLHQIDNALVFSDLGGLALVIKDLNDTTSPTIKQSAVVLGASVQSNPKVQVVALKAGALQQLIKSMSLEEDDSIKAKLLFAMSSLIRLFPYAQKKFLELGGISAIKSCFSKGITANSLQIKVVTLLQDLVTEQDQNMKNTDKTSERYIQYKNIHLREALREQGLCESIPQLLNSPDHDSREKVLTAMSSLMSTCSQNFGTARKKLEKLKSEYKILAKEEAGDEDQYFNVIYKHIKEIISQLPQTKDEL